MRFKSLCILISIILLINLSAGACSKTNTVDPSINRDIVLNSDNTKEERNQLLTEDLRYVKEELPKHHKNLYANISKKEFNARMDQLIDRIDQLSNTQVFIELNKIIVSVKDAHTSINYWDGYLYPLRFWIFDGKVFIVNADKEQEEMMYSQVLKIDGVAIEDIMEQLTSLISHENESWVLAMFPQYLQAPVFLKGLGIVKDKAQAVFTVGIDGKAKDFTVTALEFKEGTNDNVDKVNTSTVDAIIGKYDQNYSYNFLSEQNTLYFAYNACADMESRSFADFNNEMMNMAEEKKVSKIIVDLRSNSGGNSEILNPFTKRLKGYIKKKPEVKVYILVGRNTFSSGMFAIYRIKEAAPEAVSVGEPTGGALDCYGDVRIMKLPNSQVPLGYSTKYFIFSKMFRYKNEGVGTFLPDISLQPTMEDYINGNDVVLEYVLAIPHIE